MSQGYRVKILSMDVIDQETGEIVLSRNFETANELIKEMDNLQKENVENGN